jgi:hypothetical protein
VDAETGGLTADDDRDMYIYIYGHGLDVEHAVEIGMGE